MRRTVFFALLAATVVVAVGRAVADGGPFPQPAFIGAGCWKECCERWCEEQFPGQQKDGLMEALSDQDGICTCEPVFDWEAARREAARMRDAGLVP